MRLDICIGEICLYLDQRETFLVVAVVCKDFLEVLNKETYRNYWVRCYFGIQVGMDYGEMRRLWMRNKKNRILNYSAWKTDGGVSAFEIENNFYNMWEYNATSYSTHYARIPELPLNTNVNCLCYFAGGKKSKKDFVKGFNNDLWSIMQSAFPEKYAIEHFNQKKCFALDPLSEHEYDNIFDIQSVSNYDHIDFFGVNPVKKTCFKVKPTQEIPIITKIALARPFYYTGAVKTFLILACESYNEAEFTDFTQYNDIKTAESAQNLAQIVKKELKSLEFQYIEFEKGQGEGFYPLIWGQFQKIDVNHVLIQLKHASFARTCCVKLIDIDDRREDYDLLDSQPNYDITYALFIGDNLVSE